MYFLKLVVLSLGHLIADMGQGAIPLLLPYLKEIFALNYFQTGLIILATNFASSIIQPAFGLISDRYQCLWLLPLGCFAAMAGTALIGFVPNYYVLLMVVLIAGLGSASYHPEASKAVHYLSGAKKATAMSVFSVGGNLGAALGSVSTMV